MAGAPGDSWIDDVCRASPILARAQDQGVMINMTEPGTPLGIGRPRAAETFAHIHDGLQGKRDIDGSPAESACLMKNETKT